MKRNFQLVGERLDGPPIDFKVADAPECVEDAVVDVLTRFAIANPRFAEADFLRLGVLVDGLSCNVVNHVFVSFRFTCAVPLPRLDASSREADRMRPETMRDTTLRPLEDYRCGEAEGVYHLLVDCRDGCDRAVPMRALGLMLKDAFGRFVANTSGKLARRIEAARASGSPVDLQYADLREDVLGELKGLADNESEV